MTQLVTQVKIGLTLPSSHFGRFLPRRGVSGVAWLMGGGRGDGRATWMTRKLSASTGESPPTPPQSAGPCHLPRENRILRSSYLIPPGLISCGLHALVSQFVYLYVNLYVNLYLSLYLCLYFSPYLIP